MSTQKHTQGPWTLETVPTACGICYKIGPFPPKPGTSRENYACVYSDYPGNGPHDEEMLANARLIAAAPELLKALQSIVASLAEHDDEGMIEHAEQMIAARTAIAKATGDQP